MTRDKLLTREKLITRTFIIVLASLSMAGVQGLAAAQSEPRPAPARYAEWVTDSADADALVATLSAPRSSESGALHQRAVRSLALAPRLIEPTLSRIADRTRRAVVRREVAAAQQLRRLTKAQPKLPDWRIVAPATVDDLRAAYDAAQRETGIEWHYLAAVHFVETKFGRIRGTSYAGAQGPMQFLPSTWKRFGNGGDINNNTDAIAAAARFLKAQGGPANMSRALFRYNNSKLYVDAVTTYANNMAADPSLLADYHGWNVLYRWVEGDVVLGIGYSGPS